MRRRLAFRRRRRFTRHDAQTQTHAHLLICAYWRADIVPSSAHNVIFANHHERSLITFSLFFSFRDNCSVCVHLAFACSLRSFRQALIPPFLRSFAAAFPPCSSSLLHSSHLFSHTFFTLTFNPFNTRKKCVTYRGGNCLFFPFLLLFRNNKDRDSKALCREDVCRALLCVDSVAPFRASQPSTASSFAATPHPSRRFAHDNTWPVSRSAALGVRAGDEHPL